MRELKASYQRNLKSNWLVFEPQERFLLGLKNRYAFEIGMIENNNIRNFIRPVIKRVDGGMEICFDISSLQPVSRVLEIKDVRAEDIKNFIVEIICATKALEEFLLEASSVVLDPEYIFSDLNFNKFHFIYMPRSDSNTDELKKLLEHILNNIDKSDKDCLIMTYGLLQESQRQDFVISDFETILGCKKDEDGKYKNRDIEIQKLQITEDNNLIENNELPLEKESKKKQFNIFGNIFKGNKIKDTEENREDEFFEKLFDDYESENRQVCINEEKSAFSVIEPESHTVLLTEMKKPDSRRWLRDLRGRNDICISYLPFIIGKQERICDFVLDVEGVSRMHVQFFEENGELYAKDLNSRNGSMINGRQLENEENVRLFNGDLINICGMSFRLEIG